MDFTIQRGTASQKYDVLKPARAFQFEEKTAGRGGDWGKIKKAFDREEALSRGASITLLFAWRM